ncbi:hydrogenase maturation nickel metallochaperone HypA [Dendrosporobacter sp. 1207_IL3150]|uniref:hydrogenase maturation nickel metallochaperone HypA n=1 Tax=Dendrosporobacter sp. 1207_IL3150 TaxID=3084054 RepID=UPI002FD895E8
MHEMAIAQGILDIVLNTAAQHGASRVGLVRLLVGEMTQVVPQSLEFGFSALAVGTIAQNANLEVIIVPVTGKCVCCTQQFNIRQNQFQCPDCQSFNIEIISGRELLVDALEVE